MAVQFGGAFAAGAAGAAGSGRLPPPVLLLFVSLSWRRVGLEMDGHIAQMKAGIHEPVFHFVGNFVSAIDGEVAGHADVQVGDQG